MGNPKARTESTVRPTSAFAASNRTAKIEKLSTIENKDFLVRLGESPSKECRAVRGYKKTTKRNNTPFNYPWLLTVKKERYLPYYEQKR